MHLQNTYAHGLYRQLCLHPEPLPASLSLTGKAGIVTGSNIGLGYAAAIQLLQAGLSRLILAVRSPSKGDTARTSLLASLSTSHPEFHPQVEVWELNMLSYSSIQAFIQRAKDSNLYLDFVSLNAGIVRFEYEKVESTGHEITIQTNWLSNALLAIQLRKIMQDRYIARLATHPDAEQPVLSIVGSDVAPWAAFKEQKVAKKAGRPIIEMLDDPKTFDKMDRYYTSKLRILCFFLAFVDKLPKDNKVIVNLVSPGLCYGTDLHRTAEGTFGTVFNGIKRMIGRTTEVGGRTLSHALVAARKESHGRYLSDQRIVEVADFVESEEGRRTMVNLWEEMRKEFQLVINVKALVEGSV